MTEDDEPVIFEFERRDCRVVKTTTIEEVEDDTKTFVGPEFRGEDYRAELVTQEQLVDLCWDLYMELYENPRQVGYFTLATLVGDDEPPETAIVDLLAAAVDKGCEHARTTSHPMDEEEFKDGYLDTHLPKQ